jgi:outer membrane protein OmpA-like peptidoglycan-associated protein
MLNINNPDPNQDERRPGVQPGIDKPHKKLTQTITVISAMTIAAAAIAYVALDHMATMQELYELEASKTVYALEPNKNPPPGSDESDNDADKNLSLDNPDETNNDSGGDPAADGKDPNGKNGDDRDNEDIDYTAHGLPCLDPNCPIHHPKPAEGEEDGENNGDNNAEGDEKPPLDIAMDLVNFKPNQAVYVNDVQAEKVLSEYVESFNHYLEVSPDGKIYLVGCIARTKDSDAVYPGDIELSENRAETVMNTFVKLGVSEDRMAVIALGPLDPWRENEWADGTFDRDVAKHNRRVWIIPDEYKDQMDYVNKIYGEDIRPYTAGADNGTVGEVGIEVKKADDKSGESEDARS